MRLFKSLSICLGLLVAACVPVTAANSLELPNNLLEFTPYYWSGVNNQWVQFSYKSGANINTPASLLLDTSQSPTSKYIQGLDSFQSLSFQFRSDIAALDAVAVTRASPSQLRLASSKTPEPSSLLGLLALGAIGIAARITPPNRK